VVFWPVTVTLELKPGHLRAVRICITAHAFWEAHDLCAHRSGGQSWGRNSSREGLLRHSVTCDFLRRPHFTLPSLIHPAAALDSASPVSPHLRSAKGKRSRSGAEKPDRWLGAGWLPHRNWIFHWCVWASARRRPNDWPRSAESFGCPRLQVLGNPPPDEALWLSDSSERQRKMPSRSYFGLPIVWRIGLFA